MPRVFRPVLPLSLAVALFVSARPAGAQQEFCGITPQSAERIAAEIMRQAGHPFDSVTSAYYVSVLASRLAPFYVVYFVKSGMVVGEVEVDICGRQDTPHPGVQYAPDSDLPVGRLLLEPDAAFRVLAEKTGAEAVFGSRVFPYGLTPIEAEWAATDFWWLILDREGNWHYMTRLGRILGKRDTAGTPAEPPPPDSAGTP